MKAHQSPPPPAPFRPVTLTLQSQHEVNAFFAVLNHATLCKTLGLKDDAQEVLVPFKTNDYTYIHHNICDLIR